MTLGNIQVIVLFIIEKLNQSEAFPYCFLVRLKFAAHLKSYSLLKILIEKLLFLVSVWVYLILRVIKFLVVL